MKKSLVVLILVLFSTYTSSLAAQVTLLMEGTIDQVVAGTYGVGRKISLLVIFDSDAPLTSGPIGSSPMCTNFGGSIAKFLIDTQKVDVVSLNSISECLSLDPTDFSMFFSVAGFDQSTSLSENLDLDFSGFSAYHTIFEIFKDPHLEDMLTARFGYTLQKIGLDDGFLQERFYGQVDSLDVIKVDCSSQYDIGLQAGRLGCVNDPISCGIVVGDTDGDGKIGLPEAINALKVTSGTK